MKMKKLFSFPQGRSRRDAGRFRQKIHMLICFISGALLFSIPLWPDNCKAEEQHKGPEQGSLSEIGAKLANPVSNVWAIFTEFDLTFSDGDLNTGDAKVGGNMIFQPIMPFPLYGEGDHEWKMITRPIVPIIFTQPVPKGFDEFAQLGGLGDTQLPMMVSPPSGNWLLALGPTWLIPTATQDEFAHDQWGVGPAFVIGYHSKDWVAGIFPQYTWGIGGGNDASYLNLFYWFAYNLPDAWQIGFNPTVRYNNNASSGNKWNVPVGLYVARTIKMGKIPVKLQLGVEYSVVGEDDFGQVAQVKLNVIPVIQSLVKNPILGK